MNDELDQEGDPTLLCFGSILAIADFHDQNAFIFSDGFLKTSILLKNFVEKPRKVKGLQGLKNNSFNNCLFQVLPKVSDTTKGLVLRRIDDLEKTKNPLGHRNTVHYVTEEPTVPNDEDRYTVKDINEQLKSLINEYKYNLDTIDKSKNSKLSYHQPFQLMHIVSGKFLACHEVESRYENQNYLLKLDDFTSEASVFTIIPAFRYQRDGEQDVNAGEMCAITRANPISNKPTYVHCSAQELSDLKNAQNADAPVIVVPTTGEYTVYKREVNASVEESHSWKVVLFQTYIPETTRFLKVGGCIWLHHSEAESVLSVQRKVQAVDKYTFTSIDLKQWLDIQNLHVTVFSSAGSDNSESYQGSTSGLWQIEGSDFQQGGYVQFEKAYRLRNLATGYYLQVIQNPLLGGKHKVSKKREYLFSLTDVADRSTLFEFVELKTLTQDKYAKSGSYIYLKNIQYKLWVDFVEAEHDGINTYQTLLKPENERTEHAVFKIQVPSRNAVWEINFLLSCFRMLAKFLITIQAPNFPGVNHFQEKRHFIPRLHAAKACIEDLNDFVNNMQYNTSIEQQFGHINHQRQKLLREQYYIDILIKILNRIITKGELELWQNKSSILNERQGHDEDPEMQEHNLLYDEDDESPDIDRHQGDNAEAFVNKQSTQTKRLVLEYVGWKIELCNNIYKFLGSMCKLNVENQLYTYELIPYFQLQTKYLPTAIDTIIKIVASNKVLLYKLSEGLRIDFDFQNTKDIVEDANQRIRILINLYESENQKDEAQTVPEEKIPFRQHEKITSKPINLIMYFVNLIWDDEAQNNSDYLKFLRSVCRFNEEGININQENIFKLYKRYNDVKPKLGVETKAEEIKQTDGTVRLMSKAGQLMIPSDCQPGSKKFRYIIEQLTFFSEVAFDRNFLWKKELGAQFEKSFLFRNIWNKYPMDPRYESLKPCFAKIASTLYIHQEPLQEKTPPNFCQLFGECDKADDFKVFKSTVDDSQNVQELNTYNDLVLSLMEYFETLRERMKSELEDPNKGDFTIGFDLLKDELINNSTKLLYLLVRLDLLQVLEYSFNRPNSTERNYSKLIEILLYLFQYEKFELRFVKAHVATFNDVVKKAREVKIQKDQLVSLGNLKINPFGGGAPKKEEDEVEETKGESQVINEQSLYVNPIMRGYIKFANKLQSFNYMDVKHFENEVNVKVNICDILDRILDMRQNFLMQNTLVFFKHFVVKGNHEEYNEYLMSRVLQRENRGRPLKLAYKDLTQEQKDQRMIERVLKSHQVGLLPNIARTGVKDVDDPKKPEDDDPFSAFKNLKNMKMFQEKQITEFNNYIAELGITGIPEILDFDQYLSLELGDPKPRNKPIASALPTLLNSFMMISDARLEKRCIGTIMRIFNQQEEFKQNLTKLQVIFDQEKTLLFKFVQRHLRNLKKHVDRIEIWFTNFSKGYSEVSAELQECHFIVSNLNAGLHKNIRQEKDQIANDSDQIDEEKQTLVANLKAYVPVISFIREGLPYFHDLILEQEVPEPMKLQMIEAFEASFTFLRNFCFGHYNNQLLLYADLQCFTGHLQYDLGQIPLLIEIFRDNKLLLIHKVDASLIQQFTGLIEREGRQEHFLDFYEHIMQYQSKYLFDNQLLVLNNLLPAELKDRNIKVLYADGMKERDVKFYLEDVVYPTRDPFIKKLQDVEYKDTFRDEPFRYHRRLLDVLLQTSICNAEKRSHRPFVQEDIVKENFNISVGKIKKYFKADYLLDLLRESDRFVVDQQAARKKAQVVEGEERREGYSIFKLQVVELLRLIHIQAERGSVQNSELFGSFIAVSALFDFELKRLDKLNDIEQVQPGFIEYYMQGLIPFAICYYNRFLKKFQESQQGGEDDRKDYSTIEKFARAFYHKFIKLGPEYAFRSEYDVKVLKELNTCFPIPAFQRVVDLLVEEVPNREDEMYKLACTFDRIERGLSEEEYNNLAAEEVIIQHSQECLEEDSQLMDKSQKRKRVYEAKMEAKHIRHQKFLDMSPDDEANFQKGYGAEQAKKVEQLWQRFLNELLGNQHFQDHQNKEQETIAKAIISIKKLLNPQFAKNVPIRPDVKMVSKKLILFLQSAFSDPTCKNTIDTLLKILKKIIEREVEKERKTEMQNLFDSLGATQMVLLVLSENTQFIDKPMMMSFLIFINCLLEGGNQTVQKTIFTFMVQFAQSEMIFSKINSIIRKQIENIETISRYKRNKAAGGDQSMLSIDESEVEEDLRLVNQILQFLQNSVEGHYLDLQNYHRQQTSSRNNYDLILGITELFKTYYYDGFTQSNYDNMIRCLDTLNELVQGPCPDNQIAVSESKFFDIASDIFSRKRKPKPAEQQGTIDEEHKEHKEPEESEDPHKWMIARLQNKVLNLVLSLLESREIDESNQVLKRIMRNLPLTLLEKHVAKVYKKFEILYMGDYPIESLEHLTVDPRELTEKQRKKYHPKYFDTVLQNGFLLFFLISYYMECDPTIESPVVQAFKQYKKSVLKTDDSNIAAQLFKQSLLGQLFDFAQALVGSFWSIFTSMKSLAENQFKVVAIDNRSQEEKEKEKAEKFRAILKEAVNFYIRNSAHIDVCHGDLLEIVYFIKLPFTKYLPKEKKTAFHDQVDRSTTQTKVQGLIEEASNLIEVCKHEENLFRIFQKQKLLALFTNYVKLWQEFAFYLTLFLNVFILLSFDAGWGSRLEDYVFFNDNKSYTAQETRQLVQAVGVGMTCCACFVVAYFLLKNAPIILKRAWNQRGLFDGQDATNPIFWTIDKLYKVLIVIVSFLQEIEVMYYIAYGTFAVLGTVIHPFFFIFHLSEILFRYPTLKNIILSVYKPRVQLGLAFYLLMVLVYFFTIIAYVTIADHYLGQCDVLLYCLLLNMDWMIRGSIGNYIASFSGKSNVAETYGMGRFFFDNVSNILLGQIMLNIVAGIIIDTFSSLREEEAAKMEDITSNCFICGNLQQPFERNQSKSSGGFREHIKLNHYMWDYMNFIAYLRWKDVTDYSGIESFVAQKLEDDDLCWIPFNQARELKAEEGAGQSENQMIESMSNRLENVQGQLKEMATILKVNYKHK